MRRRTTRPPNHRRRPWAGDVPRHTVWLLGLAVGGCIAAESDQASSYRFPAAAELLSIEATPLTTSTRIESVAAVEGLGTFFGGPDGLFRQDGTSLTEIDRTPVAALAAWSTTLLVARADGLWIYDGNLVASPLSDDLEGPPVALSAADLGLWIGHSGGLDEVRSAQRTRWWSNPTARIATHAQTDRLVLDNRVLLSLTNETATSLDTTGSDPVVVAFDGQLYRRATDAITVRVEDTAGVSWRNVSFGDDDAPQATAFMAADPNDGRLWFGTDAELVRIDDRGLAKATPPYSLGAVQFAAVDEAGVLWLSDGQQLVGLGEPTGRPAVTWTADIADFSAANCERCHSAIGTARPLDTYEAWVAEVDAIIGVLLEGRMPLDGAPLVGGTVALVEQWKQDGLQE